jgi:type I restriction enzyme M protein
MASQGKLGASLVSLAEAATLLGVSKATLRNWDKAGKLSARRHPVNGYRLYDIAEIEQLRGQIGLPLEFGEASTTSLDKAFDLRVVKRIVGRLHDVLRDADSQSNIIGRFDEITKLIFAKVVADRTLTPVECPFSQDNISPRLIRGFYEQLARTHSKLTPVRFSRLECSDGAIIQAADVLRAFDFSSAKFDFKGLAYEEVIRNTFDKGDHQQFFTPPHIVDFIVSTCAP